MHTNVTVGQVYYHAALNEYLVATKVNQGDISYQGKGIMGHAEEEDFLARFQPVAVSDLDDDEYATLSELVDGKPLATGYIAEAA